MENTYAATLAARSFRTFMAIAARFDLELKQYDAVNAFVHASLDEEIYIRKPPDYRNDGKILKPNKALYGLRRSPLLWQKALIIIGI
jgi:Reverse transcriptase (RNA-dependent DNA polymerase)